MHRSLGRERVDIGQGMSKSMSKRSQLDVLDCSLLFKEHCRTDEMSSILVSITCRRRKRE